MGTSSSLQLSAKSPQDGQQLLYPLPLQYTPTEEQISILKQEDKPTLRAYIMMINGDEQIICANSLKFRKRHPSQLIQILYGEVAQKEKQYIKLKVYVEHIVLNLQQLIQIHYCDMMAIFYKVFKGFKILYEQFGSFTPDPRMIGFVETAEVKVWCNAKYSKSRPISTYQMLDEQKMVYQLIQIFNNKIDKNTIPFDSHRNQFKFVAKTFDEAIELIESKVQSLDLIPKTIKSIAMMIEAGRKIHQNTIVSMNSEYYSKALDKTIKFNYSNPNLKKPKVHFSFGAQTKNKANPGINIITVSSVLPKSMVTFSTHHTETSAVSHDSRVTAKESQTDGNFGDSIKTVKSGQKNGVKINQK